jgi:hypothetical protein
MILCELFLLFNRYQGISTYPLSFLSYSFLVN